ncbi:MAG: NAD-dependent epimerase/dehydratase family protein [Myxococcota bacterium]
MKSPALHVVFGTGQIGPRLAQQLLPQGHRVRLVSRRPDEGALRETVGPAASGTLEVQAADASDPEEVAEACAGAEVAYHCANPPYHRWSQDLLPLADGLRIGAGRSGARLVVLDNLYAYGRPPTAPFDEDTPLAPCSHKGRLRAEARRRLFAAHASGEVQALSAHASDFIGPRTPRSLFSPRFLERLANGRSLEGMGDLDQVHAYTYVGDVARALAALGQDGEAFGRAWHLPSTWTGSTRALFAAFAERAGHPGTMVSLSPWLLRLVGLFDKDAAGLVEMLYQWSLPYVPDARRFEARYFGATPIDTVIEATLGMPETRTASVGRPPSTTMA